MFVIYKRNIRRFSDALVIPEMTIFRIDAPIFFANIKFLKRKILKLKEKQHSKVFIFDFAAVNDVDSSAMQELQEIIKQFKKEEILVLFASVKGPVRDSLDKASLIAEVGKEKIFWEVSDAAEYGKKYLSSKNNVDITLEDPKSDLLAYNHSETKKRKSFYEFWK